MLNKAGEGCTSSFRPKTGPRAQPSPVRGASGNGMVREGRDGLSELDAVNAIERAVLEPLRIAFASLGCCNKLLSDPSFAD